jgi:hypothetical protein
MLSFELQDWRCRITKAVLAFGRMVATIFIVADFSPRRAKNQQQSIGITLQIYHI